MYIFTKTISITTDEKENKIFQKCHNIIDNTIRVMVNYNCDEMICAETNEIITLKDLKRMKGILSGLPTMDMMYSTKE